MHPKHCRVAVVIATLILVVGALSCAKPAPTPPVVTIDMPAKGGVIDHTFKVTGSFSNLPPGASIWVLVQSHDAPQYHPQSGPAIELSGGQWSTIAYAGESPFKSIGEQFEVIVVVADREASMAFLDYLREYQQMGSYPGMTFLPEGAEIVCEETVVRR